MILYSFAFFYHSSKIYIIRWAGDFIQESFENIAMMIYPFGYRKYRSKEISNASSEKLDEQD